MQAMVPLTDSLLPVFREVLYTVDTMMLLLITVKRRRLCPTGIYELELTLPI